MLEKVLIDTVLVGAAAIGLAGSPAHADTYTQDTQDFLADVGAYGISWNELAILEDANEVCWDLNVGNYDVQLTAANFQQEDPGVPLEEAVAFVVDASRIYCPAAASYDYWSYGTDASGGGGG